MQVESTRPARNGEEWGWYHRLDSLAVTASANGHEIDLDGAVYPYTDEEGNVLYLEVRTAGKRFRLQGPNGEKSIAGKVRWVPFRLPQLIAGVKRDETIYVVEGPKDALAVERAGGFATCNPKGAGSWDPAFARYFEGARVLVVQDKDDPGRKHARAVRHSLTGAAAEVKIVEAADGKDASDHLNFGYTLDEFVEPELSTWTPVDLGPVIRGEQVENPPSILARTDGPCLIYRAKVHVLYGEPEAGKGWIALAASAEQLFAGERVVYVDFEADAATVVSRLRSLGVPDDAILERFIYIRPDEPLALGEDDLAAVLQVEPALAILDGLTEALALEDVDIVNNTGVANWIREVPRRIAHSTGAGILIIDHVPHEADRMIGAQHKKAGIDVAFHIRAVAAAGRGQRGLSKIKVTKDRPGYVRPHALEPKKKESDIAEVILEDEKPGVVSISVRSPVQWMPKDVMEDVSKVLEDEDGLSQKKIVQRLKYRPKTVRDAIRIMSEQDYVRLEGGARGTATYHRLLKPFRADDEP
jgi:hypothetical protein